MDEWEKIKEKTKPLKSKRSFKNGEVFSKVDEDISDKVEVVRKPKIQKSKNLTEKSIYVKPIFHTLDDAGRVSKSSLKALKEGRVDAKIDLHFNSLFEAHEKFTNFIKSNANSGKRTLLVITGKGLHSSSDTTINSSLLDWVNGDQDLASKIVYINYASRDKGGEGAYVILLKRN